MGSEKDSQYQPKNLPLWLRKLKDVKEEVYSEIVPQSFEERLSQCLALMAHGLNTLKESIRHKFPKASEAKIK